jgi:hypothetical protein
MIPFPPNRTALHTQKSEVETIHESELGVESGHVLFRAALPPTPMFIHFVLRGAAGAPATTGAASAAPAAIAPTRVVFVFNPVPRGPREGLEKRITLLTHGIEPGIEKTLAERTTGPWLPIRSPENRVRRRPMGPKPTKTVKPETRGEARSTQI